MSYYVLMNKYEQCAIVFLNDYDNGTISLPSISDVKLEMLNENFTVTEIINIIESLKNTISPEFGQYNDWIHQML